MSDRATIFEAISAERERQDAKHDDAPEYELFLMLAALGEEVGEVNQAALEMRRWRLLGSDSQPASKAFRAELVQVAALAVRILELDDADRLYVAGPPLPEPQPQQPKPNDP